MRQGRSVTKMQVDEDLAPLDIGALAHRTAINMEWRRLVFRLLVLAQTRTGTSAR